MRLSGAITTAKVSRAISMFDVVYVALLPGVYGAQYTDKQWTSVSNPKAKTAR